ncbi:MAG: hypothetical protein Q8934_07560 [Bacillota bacterium]|nr:hypothetical protein [Bacillota bacterium]
MEQFDEAVMKAKVILNKSHTVLIVPFTYGKQYVHIGKELTENGWEICDSQNRKNILEHINILIPNNPEKKRNGAIGCEYVLNRNFREKHQLPKNESHNLYLIIDQKRKFSFKISKISLFLFETQVGFLTYEIMHTDPSLDSIIMTNYYLKHLNHLYKGSLFSQKEYHFASASIDALTENDRTLSSITFSLLGECNVTSYFASVTNEPENALVYNTILLDENFNLGGNSEEQLGKYIFYLRRTFKESYKPAPSELELTHNTQILQLFENSFWGVSLEGLSNVVYLTKDPTTNQFFQDNYQTNLVHSYFYLYMIALHQRYALLSLNQHAQELPVSESLNIEEFEEIQNARKKINYFILRCFFKHVSSVTHQQRLYELIENTLQIEALKEDLRIELEALSSVAELQQYYRIKENEKEEKRLKAVLEEQKETEQMNQAIRDKEEQERRERHADTFLLYSTIFVVISTITGAWSILTDFFVKNKQPLFHFSADIMLLIVSILFIALGFISYKQIQNKWKVKS